MHCGDEGFVHGLEKDDDDDDEGFNGDDDNENKDDDHDDEGNNDNDDPKVLIDCRISATPKRWEQCECLRGSSAIGCT